MKKSFYFSFCLFLLCFLIPTARVSEASYYYSEKYDSFSGLPTSEANDILQTQDGQI